MSVIRLDHVVTRRGEHVETQLDDETVVMNTASGEIFGMTEPASEIWRLIAEPIAVRDLVVRLVSRYAVEPETCGEEVGRFLGELERAGMLEVRTR